MRLPPPSHAQSRAYDWSGVHGRGGGELSVGRASASWRWRGCEGQRVRELAGAGRGGWPGRRSRPWKSAPAARFRKRRAGTHTHARHELCSNSNQRIAEATCVPGSFAFARHGERRAREKGWGSGPHVNRTGTGTFVKTPCPHAAVHAWH
jgi:hypothetical protein